MRDLTRKEVVAMWLWPAEYARTGMGAIEWYKQLSPSRKRNVDDFVKQYEAARKRDLPGRASSLSQPEARSE